MNKFNRTLILFLGFIFLFVLGIWQLLQSEFTAKIIQKELNVFIQKKTPTLSINFSHVSFNFFPPKVSINNVGVEYKSDELDLSIFYNSVGGELNIFNLVKNFNEVDTLSLNDGVIRLKLAEKKNVSTEPVALDFSSYFEKIDDLPVLFKKLNLKDTVLFINDESVKIDELKIKKKDDLDLDISLSEISSKKYNAFLPDSLKGTINLKQNNLIKFSNLTILKDLLKVSLNGELIVKENLEDSYFSNAYLTLDGPIQAFHDYFEFKNIGELKKGIFNLEMDLSGGLRSFTGKVNLSLENFNTSFIKGESLRSSLSINEKNIVFNTLSLKTKHGLLTLLNPFEFYNFKTNKFVEDPVLVNADKVDLSDALYYLNDTLKPLGGEVSGKVTFILNPKDFHFKVEKGAILENIGLKSEENNILKVKKLVVDFAQFDIFDDLFRMTLKAQSNKTKLDVFGEVKKDKIIFSTKDSEIDFQDFDGISGLPIKGEGPFNLIVKGDKKSTKLTLESKLKNFYFLDLSFSEIFSELIFDLNAGVINIESFSGKNYSTTINGSGTVDYNLGSLDIFAETKKTNFQELLRTLPIISKPLLPFINDVDAQLSIPSTHIYGGFDFKKIKIKTELFATNLSLFGENFDSLETKISLDEGALFFQNLTLNKSLGYITSNIDFNLLMETLDWDLEIKKMNTNDFMLISNLPLNFKSEINLESIGHLDFRDKNHFSLRKGEDPSLNNDFGLNLYLTESTSNGGAIGDSSIVMDFKNNQGKLVASFLGGRINSEVFAMKDSLGFSYQASGNIKTKLSDVLKVISGIDLQDKPLVGNIDSLFKVSIKDTDIKTLNFEYNLKELNLSRKEISLHYQNNLPELVIEDGKIKKWGLQAKGVGVALTSRGSGDLNQEFNLELKSLLSAELLELFPSYVSRASGDLLAFYHFFKNKDDQKLNLTFSGDEISISSSLLPIPIKKLAYAIETRNWGLNLSKFNIEFPTGSLSARGRVDLPNFFLQKDKGSSNIFFPAVSFTSSINEVNIPIFKRAQITLNGESRLTGRRPPYSLSSNLKIIRGDIFTELTDLNSGSGISEESYKYLPSRNQGKRSHYLNLNASISTLNPIKINNSLAKVDLLSDLQISGNEQAPILTGRVYLAPGEMRIFFKGNEYNVKKASIIFSPSDELMNPEIDFLAETIIADHKLTIEAFGNKNAPRTRLSSDPYLSQEDILSLIAFGYTDDIANNLSAEDKESLTKAGVGALIFSSLKINETLKNEFGLEVNVGTEFTQDESNYLQGRTEGNTSRVRSATKIGVTKQLSDALNLSVSSTVGSSVGQKQSMNLNYNVSKTLSVEGVYELSTRTDGEEDNTDSSAGADLKFRWSFK